MPRVAPAALVGGPEPEGRPRSPSGSPPPGPWPSARPHGPAQRAADRPERCARPARSIGQARRALVGLAEMERASGRGTERILRVARTIADLAGSDAVRPDHLEEAAWYRPADLRLAAAEAV